MQLPGGLIRDDERRRDFALRPFAGDNELALGEIMRSTTPWPRRVSEILSLLVAEIGGQEVTIDLANSLSTGDRAFLLWQIHRQLGHDTAWFSERCQDCGERYDFSLDLGAMPVKEAGISYPIAVCLLRRKKQRFRVPTGSDQEWLQNQDPEQLQSAMIHRLAIDKIDEDLTKQELEDIEAIIESIAPEMGFTGEVACPECSATASVSIDPYQRLKSANSDSLLEDIDRIARAYHWSEAEILSLPRIRRERYLTLIDRAEGHEVSPMRSVI